MYIFNDFMTDLLYIYIYKNNMTSTFEIDFPNKTLHWTTSPDGATPGLGTSTFRTSPACRATPCEVKAPTPKLRGARRRPPKPCGSGENVCGEPLESNLEEAVFWSHGFEVFLWREIPESLEDLVENI